MTHCVGTWYPIPNVLRNLAQPISLRQTYVYCIDTSKKKNSQAMPKIYTFIYNQFDLGSILFQLAY